MKASLPSLLLFAACATASLNAAELSGTLTQEATDNVDLTSVGTTDWAVWGTGSDTSLTPNDRKQGGSAISALTNLGLNTSSEEVSLRGLGQFGSYGESTFQWSDGTNAQTASEVTTGLQHDGGASEPAVDPTGTGFSFTISGTALQGQIDLWFGVHRGLASLSATLNGASPVTFTLEGAEAGYASENVPGHLVLEYTKDNADDPITVSLTLSTNYSPINSGNVFVNAVSISALEEVPEPSSFALLGLGCLGFAALRRKRAA